MYIKNLQDSYFILIFSYLVKNVADTLYFRLAILHLKMALLEYPVTPFHINGMVT